MPLKQAAKATPQLCTRFHYASELIGRRWNGAIIFMLLKQTCRFAALRDGIPDITDRMLSERLQELEQEGVVERAGDSRYAGARRILADEEGQGARRRDRFDRGLGGEIRAARGAGPQAPEKNGSRRQSRRAMIRA